MHINLEAAYCPICQCNQRVKLVQVGAMDVCGMLGADAKSYKRHIMQCVNGHVLANLGCIPLPPMTTAASKDDPNMSELDALKRRVKVLEDYTYHRVTSPQLQTVEATLQGMPGYRQPLPPEAFVDTTPRAG